MRKKAETTLEIRCPECNEKYEIPFSQIFNKGYHKKLFFHEGMICPGCKGTSPER